MPSEGSQGPFSIAGGRLHGGQGTHRYCREVMEPSDDGTLPLNEFFPKFLHTPQTRPGDEAAIHTVGIFYSAVPSVQSRVLNCVHSVGEGVGHCGLCTLSTQHSELPLRPSLCKQTSMVGGFLALHSQRGELAEA